MVIDWYDNNNRRWFSSGPLDLVGQAPGFESPQPPPCWGLKLLLVPYVLGPQLQPQYRCDGILYRCHVVWRSNDPQQTSYLIKMFSKITRLSTSKLDTMTCYFCLAMVARGNIKKIIYSLSSKSQLLHCCNLPSTTSSFSSLLPPIHCLIAASLVPIQFTRAILLLFARSVPND